uniref:Uncharacterized protein n=1 Tax=Streptomyces sp. NBC_01401 TaxID=2903854 RepID=A0AAU3GMD4_9ACTN
MFVIASAYPVMSRSSVVNVSASRQCGIWLALARSGFSFCAWKQPTSRHQSQSAWEVTAICANGFRPGPAASQAPTSAPKLPIVLGGFVHGL